jgi:hypothetical protein
LQHNPLISIENFALSRSGKPIRDTATCCKVISPLSPPQYQNSTPGPDRLPGGAAWENLNV